ncbi:MAG: o-succinylbenzoate synthase [Geitlerinemataceae cyanobacterium]
MADSTTYALRYRTYRRSFRRPLKTAHGVWSVREGLVLELRGEAGAIGIGEVAPLPWFGSETLEAAIAFCHSLGGAIEGRAIEAIPKALPACQFAFESAREMLRGLPVEEAPDLEICRLLPAGAAALAALDRDPDARTYKWKIGTAALTEELEILMALRDRLPVGTRLRLDANGGLDREAARRWLDACDRFGDGATGAAEIEFLEQPLPVAEFDAACELAQQFATPIALDESVASLAQIEEIHRQGWRGIYVIKPAIVGSPRRLRSLCRTHGLDAVFSSVFETEIGRDAGLRLAAALQSSDRAVGYGLDGWLSPAVWSRFGSR